VKLSGFCGRNDLEVNSDNALILLLMAAEMRMFTIESS
jgi:hypothetical protein